MDKSLEDLNNDVDMEETSTNEEEVEEVEKTREELLEEALQQQKEESKQYYEQYLRALAEVENMKKRLDREREEYIKYGNTALIKKILPVIDDLNRALEATQSSNDIESLGKGVEMTVKRLIEVLNSEGVQEIESLGKEFDPQYHQALLVEHNEAPENTIIEEFQRGFILHDRVIRPSLVKVSGGPA
jgi:molecular chaperone GrpE